MRADIPNQLEAKKEANRPVHLVRIDLGCSDITHNNQSACEINGGTWTDPIFITDWDRAITWKSNEYLAVGYFMGLGNITEISTLQVSSLSLYLSGVDQESLSLFLRDDYIDRPITIYRSFVNEAGLLITIPFEIFRGQIDQPVITDSPTSTGITVSAKNHLANFDRKSGRHTNNAEMKRYYPNDTSFVYASDSQKEIEWGSE